MYQMPLSLWDLQITSMASPLTNKNEKQNFDMLPDSHIYQDDHRVSSVLEYGKSIPCD